VTWCGCNPSRADAHIDDPTIRVEIGLSYRWQYGRLVKVNFHPFITPDMKQLSAWLKDTSDAAQAARRRNLDIIAGILADSDLCVAAWGNLVPAAVIDIWLDQIDEAVGRKIEWHCIGTTKSGAPTHPMARGKHRVPTNQKPILWRSAV
jgi:hypothetical protein